MVGKKGLEPSRCFHHRILSPMRLPIPPLPQIWRFVPGSNRRSQSCSLLPYHLANEPLLCSVLNKNTKNQIIMQQKNKKEIAASPAVLTCISCSVWITISDDFFHHIRAKNSVVIHVISTNIESRPTITVNLLMSVTESLLCSKDLRVSLSELHCNGTLHHSFHRFLGYKQRCLHMFHLLHTVHLQHPF